jgi:hypothetical protein
MAPGITRACAARRESVLGSVPNLAVVWRAAFVSVCRSYAYNHISTSIFSEFSSDGLSFTFVRRHASNMTSIIFNASSLTQELRGVGLCVPWNRKAELFCLVPGIPPLKLLAFDFSLFLKHGARTGIHSELLRILHFTGIGAIDSSQSPVMGLVLEPVS